MDRLSAFLTAYQWAFLWTSFGCAGVSAGLLCFLLVQLVRRRRQPDALVHASLLGCQCARCR